jgi:hypothetical protein
LAKQTTLRQDHGGIAVLSRSSASADKTDGEIRKVPAFFFKTQQLDLNITHKKGELP